MTIEERVDRLEDSDRRRTGQMAAFYAQLFALKREVSQLQLEMIPS